MSEQFKKDVLAGLANQPKTLPSKYFYDERGSELFSKIMHLPEYYLTRAELDIFKRQSAAIIKSLKISNQNYFELIELGAGDGYKTIELLKELENGQYDYRYTPIDISDKALDQLTNNLKTVLPATKLFAKKGDYFKVLGELKQSNHHKIVMFLGSNIGNMKDDRAKEFLTGLSANLNVGDKVLLGVDLKKAKKIVLPAYNDSSGVTRSFNLNLLDRINKTLDADFNLDQFEHSPEYDENEGIARSFITSTVDQTVNFGATTIEFKKGEKIHTEISRKYDDTILENLCLGTGLSIGDKFLDQNAYFADYILTKVN